MIEGDAVKAVHHHRPEFDYWIYPLTIEAGGGIIYGVVYELDERMEMTPWVLEHSLITAGLPSLTPKLEGAGVSFTMDGNDAILVTAKDDDKTVYSAIYSPDEVEG